MGQRHVRLEPLDWIIYYGLSAIFGLPVLVFTGYLIVGQIGFIKIGPTLDLDIGFILIPILFMGSISLLFFLVQRDKLKFEYIKISLDSEKFKYIIKEISKECRWSIRSFKEDTFTIKTNPGFVNQQWGQHITIRLVDNGILINSIFDPNKGSFLLTFGGNKKNIAEIKRRLTEKLNKQTLDTAQPATIAMANGGRKS